MLERKVVALSEMIVVMAGKVEFLLGEHDFDADGDELAKEIREWSDWMNEEDSDGESMDV